LAPWAEVLYACDAKWWRQYEASPVYSWRTHQGLKVAMEPRPSDHEIEFDRWPEVTVLGNAGLAGLARRPNALSHGYNSGYQAINLAVHLGASRIVLLGYDMAPGTTGWHFFGSHPWQVDIPFQLFMEQYANLIGPLADLGIEVVNASRKTALMCFPRVALEECLA
jgi:hypothetical protein